ncbi:MAG TPA: MFS transporter [Planctomycetes bacterium]|nr:MFS transporter [Planctomycetota bacterium]HIL37498.1 MFS transporter [Planctomycetota bacterium]
MSLDFLPSWMQNFLPILAVLVAITFVLRRLPKVELGHSAEFIRRRVWNWLPLGLTYAFLYMGRYNINVVKVVLDPETGIALLTKAELATITVFGTTTYALSFLINGPLADRYGGRRTIMAAAVGSALANILMGFVIASGYETHRVAVLGALYSLNMYFQSFGAVSIVKVNANWFHVKERGVFGGIFGILISLGLYFAYDWGTPIAQNMGPEWAFFVPAGILLLFAVLDHRLVFDRPGDVGHRNFDPGDGNVTSEGEVLSPLAIARRMLANRTIMVIILIETCSGFVRGGIMKWGYVFANETGQSMLTGHWGAFLCVAGILGGVFAGTVSDRVFQSRRGPVAFILYGLASLSIAAAVAVITSPMAGFILLFAILSVIGVHGMLSGTASMDFGGRRNAGLAVGIIDGMVYLGFGAQSIILGYVLPTGEAQTQAENWRIWLFVILPVAIIGMLLSLRIWNATPRRMAAEPKAVSHNIE